MASNITDLIKALERQRDEFLSNAKAMDETINILKTGSSAILSTINSYKNEDGGLFKTASNQNDSPKASVPDKLKEKYRKYDINASLRNKIATIIKTENRFLHVREIAEIANRLEPHISKDAFMSKFSPSLSTMKNIPGSTIINFIVGKSNLNNFWGSKNWLDEDGSIKKEYMYDEMQLKSANTEQFVI